MAITIQGYNVGTDTSFSITDQYGDLFLDSEMGRLIDFDARSDDKTLKVTPIDNGGLPIYQTIWSGVTGRMRLVRYGPTFDQLMAELMSGYYGFGLIPQFSMVLSVRNRDASVDEFLLPGFQFARPDFWKSNAEKEMEEGVEFHASQIIGTGALTPFLGGLSAAAA